jgi:mono/diheme cytochrome c family protein
VNGALKSGAAVTAALTALVGAGALSVHRAGIPRYGVERIELRVEGTPEHIARGKKLATLLCLGCHLDPRTGRLTGRHMADVPPKFGVVFSSNITGDRTKGIGAWSDGEIAYLLRTGVARDGRYVPPWMIKLPHMADDDLAAIIAFLRSSDALVVPTSVDPPGVSCPSFLTKLLCRVAFKKLPYPRRRIEAPPASDTVAYGRYLVVALDCYGCHSSRFERMNIEAPERSAGYLGGGNALIDLRGRTIRSANLTFDAETGIGTWSEDDLARALRQGFRPDGTPVRAPMAPMRQLTGEEIGALYAYLATVPKIRNAVPRLREADDVPTGASSGKRVYYKYACVSCHGDGGAAGNADLTQAANHFRTRAELEAWIRDAPSIKPDTRMPAWQGVIAEEEYGPLIDYVLELGTPGRAPTSDLRSRGL